MGGDPLIRTVKPVAGRWTWTVARNGSAPTATAATLHQTWEEAARDCYIAVPGGEDLIVVIPKGEVCK